jgi:hypothetical protein
VRTLNELCIGSHLRSAAVEAARAIDDRPPVLDTWKFRERRRVVDPAAAPAAASASHTLTRARRDLVRSALMFYPSLAEGRAVCSLASDPDARATEARRIQGARAARARARASARE